MDLNSYIQHYIFLLVKDTLDIDQSLLRKSLFPFL